jgi:hypothetical protein
MLNYIQPPTLIEWVENTAPYLFRDSLPSLNARLIELDFRHILHAAKHGYPWPNTEPEYIEDYFALCLAAHHSTVASFIPTDVDSKIRGLLWRDNRDPASRERMFEFALRAMHWPMEGISARYTELAGLGPVSGHNGEQLSVLLGALQVFLQQSNTPLVERAMSAIGEELRRESIEFQTARETKGAELDVLRLSAWLTHNAGDVDQGFSYWPNAPQYESARREFSRLAHENTKPFGGIFADAAALYKKVMAPEGHRNYPLRSIKALRQSSDLLLPQSPFLDDWGALVATHSSLDNESRAETLGALITGSRKLPGQRGYYRAIRGLLDQLGESGLQRLLRLQPNSVRKEYENPALRKLIAVPRSSFESSLSKLVKIVPLRQHLDN